MQPYGHQTERGKFCIRYRKSTNSTAAIMKRYSRGLKKAERFKVRVDLQRRM